MILLAFLLNLPWTLAGLLLGIISLPRGIRLHFKPFGLIITVRSFWWQTWLPGYGGVRASSIGAVVLLGKKLLANDLEHELVHVAQYEREPLIHPFLYVYQSLRYGYKNNKYEIEAYTKAKNKYVEK
jgi:hypothetical protein